MPNIKPETVVDEYESFIAGLHSQYSGTETSSKKNKEKEKECPSIEGLTMDQQIECMQIKYKWMLARWEDFESKVKLEDYTGAAACFSRLLIMGFSKAAKLYDKIMDENETCNLPSKIKSKAFTPEDKLYKGLRYQLALGVRQNYKKASVWFEKAAEDGNSIAQLYCFYAYYYGYGVKKKEKKARNFLEKSAGQGNPRAQRELACLYDKGKGQNNQTAKLWYLKPANKLDAQAQYRISFLYQFEEKDKGRHWLTMSAEQGNPFAQYKLALILKERGTRKRGLAGFALWIRKAAEQGHIEAQKKLGFSYYSWGSEPVMEYWPEAVEWFSKAAEQGDSTSLRILGDIYQEGGIGVKRNTNKSIYWYRKAAEQGEKNAFAGLKKIQTPFAKYTLALIEKNYAKILEFVLESDDLQCDFFDKEWLRIADQIKDNDAEWDGFYTALQQAAQSLKKNPNAFLVDALLNLKKAVEQGMMQCDEKTTALMIKMLQTISFEDTEADKITPFMRCICELYFQDLKKVNLQSYTKANSEDCIKEYFDQAIEKYANHLIKLWHRREAFQITTDDSGLNKLFACILLRNYTNTGQYQVSAGATITHQDLRWLVTNYEGDNYFSIEEINQLLGKELLVQAKKEPKKVIPATLFSKNSKTRCSASDQKTQNKKASDSNPARKVTYHHTMFSNNATSKTAIPGEKPGHPQRSEGSPESSSVPRLGDPSLRSG